MSNKSLVSIKICAIRTPLLEVASLPIVDSKNILPDSDSSLLQKFSKALAETSTSDSEHQIRMKLLNGKPSKFYIGETIKLKILFNSETDLELINISIKINLKLPNDELFSIFDTSKTGNYKLYKNTTAHIPFELYLEQKGIYLVLCTWSYNVKPSSQGGPTNELSKRQFFRDVMRFETVDSLVFNTQIINNARKFVKLEIKNESKENVFINDIKFNNNEEYLYIDYNNTLQNKIFKTDENTSYIYGLTKKSVTKTNDTIGNFEIKAKIKNENLSFNLNIENKILYNDRPFELELIHITKDVFIETPFKITLKIYNHLKEDTDFVVKTERIQGKNNGIFYFGKSNTKHKINSDQSIELDINLVPLFFGIQKIPNVIVTETSNMTSITYDELGSVFVKMKNQN